MLLQQKVSVKENAKRHTSQFSSLEVRASSFKGPFYALCLRTTESQNTFDFEFVKDKNATVILFVLFLVVCFLSAFYVCIVAFLFYTIYILEAF